ncbi:MAG: hypothetical protein KDC52_00700 [Ignavibacteriae bacterium]|nr:hypothetical protein [Ignavibacteriota bacterium]HPF10722.1 hypothetical protein [Flavobacteriaceae bacterium]HQU66445.1 hypothetical protein [Flavobacteriaceae bacterium]HRW43163.1 hypothetical protein [Flavobacteriaceae bacterium]
MQNHATTHSRDRYVPANETSNTLMKSMQEIKEQYFIQMENYRKKELEDNAKVIEEFIRFCKRKNIILTKDNFNYIQPIGIVAKYPDLLNKLNTGLTKNDEELISCELINKFYSKKSFESGFLYSQNYVAMAHPFFRRGFSENANFAPRFIDLFWKLEDKDIDLYVALDANRVRVDVDGPSYLEEDTWYGASFNKEINKIPNGLVKLKPPMDLEDFSTSFLFKDVYSLDIKWSEKDGIKTFHAEEINIENVTVKIDGEEFHPVRYVHAEYVINKNHFRHFDGAIHLYQKYEYFQRRESDLNFNEKIEKHLKAKTFKIFKMNGLISIETWITYTSHFFTGNPLIFEYFEGKYPEQISEIINKIRKNAST